MKKNMLSAVLLITIIASSGAAVAKNEGPETIKMKTVPASFKHWEHQRHNGTECFHCHSDAVDYGKIKGWGKEAAHGLCIPCHDLNEKGPVECKQCHEK